MAAAVSGSSVGLSGGTGIAHTGAGDVTSTGTLTATARIGDIGMADDTVYQVGGATSLTAQNNIALGRIEASANPITITATTGAISNNPAGEGANNENLVGGAVNLTTGSGIGGAGNANIDTAAVSLDAQAGGNIFINETDDLALGHVDAGASNITLMAGGAIKDKTPTDDSQENLVGSNIALTGGTGIGASGDADIDTDGDAITATISGSTGDVFIDEAGAVQIGGTVPTGTAEVSVTPGSSGGSLGVTSGGAMTVTQALTTAGNGAIELTAKGGTLQINDGITAGGNVALTGNADIRHAVAGGVTAGGTVRAEATTGDISMADGTVYDAEGSVTLTAEEGNVALGRVVAGSGAGAITVEAGGAISDNTAAEGGTNSENLVGGAVTLQAGTSIGLGTPREVDIDVAVLSIDAQTAAGGGFINVTDPEPNESPPEEIRIPDKITEPEKIPDETISLQGIGLQEVIDSAFSSTDGSFGNLSFGSAADAQVLPEYDGVLPDYGVPDYGAAEESDQVHLSGANESLWGNQESHDDESESSEEEESEAE